VDQVCTRTETHTGHWQHLAASCGEPGGSVCRVGETIWFVAPYFTGARLKRLYLGDIIHVHVLGRHMVVLSSLQAARDLLESRGSIYSDRPRFVLLSEMFVELHRLCHTNDSYLNRMGWENASTHLR